MSCKHKTFWEANVFLHHLILCLMWLSTRLCKRPLETQIISQNKIIPSLKKKPSK